MVSLNDFKDFYSNHIFLGRRKPSNKDFLERFFNDRYGSNPIALYGNSKISSVMNGYALTSEDYNGLIAYFKKKENMYTLSKQISDDLEGANVSEVYKYLKELLEKNASNSLMKKLVGAIKSSYAKDAVKIVLTWMFIFLFLKDEAYKLEEIYNPILQKYTAVEGYGEDEIKIEEFLENNAISRSYNGARFCAEIPDAYYYELRKKIIDIAQGTLMIAGETLKDAFSTAYNDEKSIIQNVNKAINEKRLKHINIFVADPSIFINPIEPIENIRTTVNTLVSQFSAALNNHGCKMNIYFLPFMDIDHAVITDNFLLFRTTKLFTNVRDFKGSIMLFNKHYTYYDTSTENKGEYYVHKHYLEILAKHSICIDTYISYRVDYTEPKDMQVHKEIRNAIFQLKKIEIKALIYISYIRHSLSIMPYQLLI